MGGFNSMNSFEFVILALALVLFAGWCFRSTRKPKPLALPKPPTKWQKVLKRFPVGSKFQYLGVEMVVIQSQDYCDLGENLGWDDGELITEYVDKNGVLQSKRFGEQHTDALLSL